MTKITNTLTGVVAMLVAMISAGAFVLSYDALYATGAAHGLPPTKVWIWPLLIDAPLVVFTLALLIAQLTRQGIKLWAGLVILYTLATVAFNLSHAQPTPLGWTVAIVAPVGLLLTTEALRHLSRGIIERGHAILSLAELGQTIDHRRADLDRIERQTEAAQARLEAIKSETKREISANVHELNAARAAKVDTRRQEVLTLLGQGLSDKDIAGELGVTVKTIRRDMQALNGKAEALR